MNYFINATGGNTPILIKDIFNSNGYSKEINFSISINGKK